MASPRLAPNEVALLRESAAAGSLIVAWQHPSIVQERFPSPDIAASLGSHGISAVPLHKALGEKADVEVDEAVIAWMKVLGRTLLESQGGTFRTLFRHRQLSLWWWAELYLYHDTPLRLLVRDIEALARLIELRRPDRLVVVAPVRCLAAAAHHLADCVEIHGPSTPTPSSHLKTSLRFSGALLKMLGTGLKSLARRSPTVSGSRQGPRRLLFLTHASMWRKRINPVTGSEELVEMYFDQILPELRSAGDEIKLVAVGPPVPFKQRSVKLILRDVLELGASDTPYVSIRNYFTLRLSIFLAVQSVSCWRMWRRFRRLNRLEGALTHRGVFLGKAALEPFRDTFLLQIPWAIRSYHEMRSVLCWERPDLLVLYAESSGLGRAAVAAARELDIPSFAIQHGIMYPRYYSHEHAPDEVNCPDGLPIPAKTAVFGGLARDLLVSRSHYPPERIVITGSPKFDGLVRTARRYDRESIRRRLGIDRERPLLVAASRFSAIGPVFGELVRAVETFPELLLLVKPHQAESPELYRTVVAQEEGSRTRVVSASENLLELLVASDGLITVDSFASSEALVLGRPVLVVNLPSNLGPLVDRGVALGVYRGESIEARLRNLLFESEMVSELERRRKEYLQEFAFGADGGATKRIIQALRETADCGRTVT